MEPTAVDKLGILYQTALELEVADTMIDLSSMKDDPTELTAEDKNQIIRAAYALVDLKKINIKLLKDQLGVIKADVINPNVDFLVKSGILPPVSKRERTPSKKVKEILAQEEDERKQEEARLGELAALQESRLKDLPDDWDKFPAILKNLPICDHNSASIVMDTLFPKDVTETWRAKKKTCRQIYELSDVNAQCNNVVKQKTAADDVCYICGFMFDEKVQGLQRACEHILPIVQAVFFLELYTTGKAINNAQLLEYDWAHRCCNYVKNDYSFLATQMVNNYPTYVFNTNQTSVTLSLIQNTKENPKTGKQKFIGLDRIQEQISSNPKWKEQRFNYIRDVKMKPIVNYIASHGDNGVALMIGYRNCLDNKNIHSSFLTLLMGGSQRKEQPPPKRRKGGKTFRRKNNGKLSTSRKRHS